MKKNNNKKNETLAKAKNLLQVDFDAEKLAEMIERKMEQLPVLTKAEQAELFQKAVGFGHEMADKGCWIGLGLIRREDGEPKRLVQTEGNMALLTLLVAEAMDCNPELEKVFLLAVGLRMKFNKDDNEEEA